MPTYEECFFSQIGGIRPQHELDRRGGSMTFAFGNPSGTLPGICTRPACGMRTFWSRQSRRDRAI